MLITLIDGQMVNVSDVKPGEALFPSAGLSDISRAGEGESFPAQIKILWQAAR